MKTGFRYVYRGAREHGKVKVYVPGNCQGGKFRIDESTFFAAVRFMVECGSRESRCSLKTDKPCFVVVNTSDRNLAPRHGGYVTRCRTIQMKLEPDGFVIGIVIFLDIDLEIVTALVLGNSELTHVHARIHAGE